MSGRTVRARSADALSALFDDRLGLVAPRVALLALAARVLAARGLDLSVPFRAQMVVYLVGMVALNLPNGGYEHLANLRRRRFDVRWRYPADYLALVAAFVGLFLLAPVPGLALALCVAMAKGGRGDLPVQPFERVVVRRVAVELREEPLEHVRHQLPGRPGVEPEPVAGQRPGVAAEVPVLFDQRHVRTRPGEVGRRREAADTPAHDGDRR